MWTLVVLSILFGVVVLNRAAWLTHRRTDLGCYQRAAWAVRVGGDMYHTPDDNGWHYNYPPLLAILLVPLADAPQGAERTGLLPYSLTVVAWYFISLAFGVWGAHLLATALEETNPDSSVRDQPRYCQRWWSLRLWPILILLPAIGRTQGRGQINLILAFLFSGMAAAMLRNQRLRAGIWLAAAISMKFIPGFLLLLPLWRRDLRMILGCVAGLLLGGVVIPLAALGPEGTVQAYRTFYKETLRPGLTGNAEGSRARELTGVTSTSSNSPVVVIHNIMHPYPRRESRPKTASAFAWIVHWAVAGTLTLVTLIAAGWRRAGDPRVDVLFMSALLVLMWTSGLVFHLHYMAMAVPVVMVMLDILWQRNGFPQLPRRWWVLFIFLFLAHVLTIDRALWFFRDFGLVLLAALALWLASVVLMRQVRLVA